MAYGDLSIGAKTIVSMIVQTAGNPGISDEVRGQLVAEDYAALKALFDAE